tara:strand:+ start:650 stop:856 length:207 start_codon:yes stop_codon:yes gene_type:complete
MDNIVELDSFQSLENIMERDYKTNKFVVSCYLENGNLMSHISDGMTDMELCYLIENLKDRRRAIHGSE